MKDESSKEKLYPLLSALLQNKDVLNSLLTPTEKSEKDETKEKAAPSKTEEDGSGEKSEAIEKFLNSYFR